MKLQKYDYDISIILKVVLPFGVSATANCPALLPINALPKGDASEIFPSKGLASDGLTKVYFDFFFLQTYSTLIVVPTRTLFVPFPVQSAIIAVRSITSISLILASSRPCCSLAASRGAFSLTSPSEAAL